MYFNIVTFIASGFVLAFLFRNVAIQALAGLKLRTPLYYSRIRPLDILLALSLNDLRSLLTLSIAILGLVSFLLGLFSLTVPGWLQCLSSYGTNGHRFWALRDFSCRTQ